MRSIKDSSIEKVVAGDTSVRKDHKSLTRSLILELYKQYGLNVAIERAQCILRQSEDKRYPLQKRIAVKGELSEAVLEVVCVHLQKLLPQSILLKGLCISKKTDPLVTTEMDLVLFTPFCLYMFECKSYSGSKILKDACTLVGSHEQNIYAQNRMHFDLLFQYISPFMLRRDKYPPGNPPVKLILFELSSGDIEDRRESKYQKLYPCITLDTICDWIQDEFSKERVVLYDLPRLAPVLEELDQKSAETFKRHVKRLQSRRN